MKTNLVCLSSLRYPRSFSSLPRSTLAWFSVLHFKGFQGTLQFPDKSSVPHVFLIPSLHCIMEISSNFFCKGEHSWSHYPMDFFPHTFWAPHRNTDGCEPVISVAASLSGSSAVFLFPLRFNRCETFQRASVQVGGTELWSNGLWLHPLFLCYVICRDSYPLLEEHICIFEHHTATHRPIKKLIPQINDLQCVRTDTGFGHARLMSPYYSTFCNASLLRWPTFPYFPLKVQTWIFHLNNRVPH